MATRATEADQAAASFQHVPIRKMLGDLAIKHPKHVDMLNLESATRGLHANEHSTIDGKL
jgi:hypothetical protein